MGCYATKPARPERGIGEHAAVASHPAGRRVRCLAVRVRSRKPRLASVNTNPSPYASGKIHTEPLYYNGKTYQVRMQHRVSDGIFLVNVSAPGRRLGTTPGDGEIVSEVGRNAVNHFACPDSQRARVQPGSARPAANQGWDMRVKCG